MECKHKTNFVVKTRSVLAVAFLTCVAVAEPAVWTFPRTASCHEGLPFSDGVTGVLVWGGGETVNLTVGRADLWDHRGGHVWKPGQTYANIVDGFARGDRAYLSELFKREPPKPGEPQHPFMLPLGRVVVTVPGAELVKGMLDPFTGLGELEFARSPTQSPNSRFRAEIAMAKEGRVFALRFPEGVDFSVKAVPAMTQPAVRKALLPLGYKEAEMREDGFTWAIPGDPSVTLRAATKDRTLFVQTSRGEDGVRALPGGFESVAEASRAHWTRFWAEGARVKVPDPVIQRIYDFAMYKFGAITDPDGAPAGLQGTWLEDDKLVPWDGDFHFNVNVQLCYAPACRSGHPAHLRRLLDTILAARPTLAAGAKTYAGVEDGIFLATTEDDSCRPLGVGWVFSTDHASTAWVATMMYDYVKYTGDDAFLKEKAYPFMAGVMKVYRAMMRDEADGKLMIPCGSSPEWDGSPDRNPTMSDFVGTNAAYQVAGAHRLARDLQDAARRLGVTPDPMWADVRRRLPKYERAPIRPDGWYDDGILVWRGQKLSHAHRHHSHMAGFWPFDVIDLGDRTERSVADLTYWNWTLQGMGNWAGWSMPWASILQTHIGNRDAAVTALHLWETYFTNPGHGSRHDVYHPGIIQMRRGRHAFAAGVDGDAPGEEIMQIEGQCGAAAAVLELLAHEVNGKTEFFRGCPDTWTDVSFENLALPDSTRINGRRLNGKVSVEKVADLNFR